MKIPQDRYGRWPWRISFGTPSHSQKSDKAKKQSDSQRAEGEVRTLHDYQQEQKLSHRFITSRRGQDLNISRLVGWTRGFHPTLRKEGINGTCVDVNEELMPECNAIATNCMESILTSQTKNGFGVVEVADNMWDVVIFLPPPPPQLP
jgi:hypothetical protein